MPLDKEFEFFAIDANGRSVEAAAYTSSDDVSNALFVAKGATGSTGTIPSSKAQAHASGRIYGIGTQSVGATLDSGGTFEIIEYPSAQPDTEYIVKMTTLGSCAAAMVPGATIYQLIGGRTTDMTLTMVVTGGPYGTTMYHNDAPDGGISTPYIGVKGAGFTNVPGDTGPTGPTNGASFETAGNALFGSLTVSDVYTSIDPESYKRALKEESTYLVNGSTTQSITAGSGGSAVTFVASMLKSDLMEYERLLETINTNHETVISTSDRYLSSVTLYDKDGVDHTLSATGGGGDGTTFPVAQELLGKILHAKHLRENIINSTGASLDMCTSVFQMDSVGLTN